MITIQENKDGSLLIRRYDEKGRCTDELYKIPQIKKNTITQLNYTYSNFYATIQ